MTATQQHPRSILRLPDLERAVGLSRATIYAKVKAGEFPRPIELGARAVGWRSDEVATWLDSRPKVDVTRPGVASVGKATAAHMAKRRAA